MSINPFFSWLSLFVEKETAAMEGQTGRGGVSR